MTAPDRLRRLLPALWLGMLLAIGALAAPASFEALARADAGRVNAAIFAREAWASIALALAVGALERRAGGAAPGAGLLLAGAALFCTLLGQFGVAPAMQAARAGAAGWTFAQAHGASLALYAAKTICVAALAWRAAGAPALSRPTSSPSGPSGGPS